MIESTICDDVATVERTKELMQPDVTAGLVAMNNYNLGRRINEIEGRTDGTVGDWKDAFISECSTIFTKLG